MKKYLTIYTLFILTLSAAGQGDPKTAIGKLGPNPVFIVDSQKVNQSDLSKYSSDSIATVIMLYDTSATKLYGDAAKDGAVIIETRSFARSRIQIPCGNTSWFFAIHEASSFIVLNERIGESGFVTLGLILFSIWVNFMVNLF